MFEFNLSHILSFQPSHQGSLAINLSSVQDLEVELFGKYGITADTYYLLSNGRKLDSISGNCHGIIHVIPRTLGGKGGFGSMLRAIGAQIEKTTNREACRDLSGRRLRDINEEQRLKNWIGQQAEREKEAAERKQKKLERLCQEPKHEFKDEKYDESRSVMTEVMSSSVEQGFKACTSGIPTQKRKSDDKSLKARKKKKKLLMDSDLSSEGSSDEEENPSSGNKTAVSLLN